MAFETPRFYQINGEQMVSVTTFLRVMNKPFLMGWAVKEERKVVLELLDNMVERKKKRSKIQEAMHELCTGKSASDKIAQSSAAFGRAVHAAIDAFIKKENYKDFLETKQQEKVFSNWREWWEAKDFKGYVSEETVHNSEHRYAGTLDLRTRDCIWDWKTGKGVGYSEQHLQNVAYRMAHNEKHPNEPIEKGILVHVPSNGDPVKEVKVKDKYTEEHVIACLCLWKMENKY